MASRWSLSNALPVMFVLSIIATIWYTYWHFHLKKLLQLDASVDKAIAADRHHGLVDATISQTLVLLMSLCFLRAVFTEPGAVPNSAEWLPAANDRAWGSSSLEAPLCNEVKQSKRGERRFCRKCVKYKPDRCHHCRVCGHCILRMDHHCPWIANCVGFRNHKYFFLLVGYSAASCSYVFFTLWGTAWKMIAEEEMSSVSRFSLVFGMTLAAIMDTLLLLFFSFHIWLMSKASTTIEFCEKSTSYGGDAPRVSYNHGAFESARAVLGPYVLLWLLPICPPRGDGLFFPAVGQSRTSDEQGKNPEVTGPPASG
eukprot:TRINITY_DN6789_c0_g1_i2.p1 TRINITY_DN6789_c0_g1~~TRINITY_DN6789_c0_g1_i2.p1  ORF type:complete len:312 (+),score=43.37 TRINITY_DN6789_c0_g1_i2:106-1041(+)